MNRELAERWDVEGFVSPLDVMPAAEMAGYRAQFDALEARVGQAQAEIRLQDRHFDEPFVRELATHPRVLDAVEALIGPDVVLLSSHFFCKYPTEERGERFVAWHQDVTYWGLEPAFAVSAWLAIDDADVENGCMRFVPGSHRGGILEHGKSGRAGNLLSVDQAVPFALVDERRAISVPLRAGQMSIHHGLLLHASHPNHSNRRRCGLTLRYVPPSVRQVAPNSVGRWYRALVVRGEDRYRHFPSPVASS